MNWILIRMFEKFVFIFVVGLVARGLNPRRVVWLVKFWAIFPELDCAIAEHDDFAE